MPGGALADQYKVAKTRGKPREGEREKLTFAIRPITSHVRLSFSEESKRELECLLLLAVYITRFIYIQDVIDFFVVVYI